MHACVTSNVTSGYECANGQCVNASDVCDSIRHYADGSDEDFTHALCYWFHIPLSPPVIAAIVVACLVVLGVLFCMVGATVDCVVHMHKYWCSCVRKTYNEGGNAARELSTFRSPSIRTVHHIPPQAPPLTPEAPPLTPQAPPTAQTPPPPEVPTNDRVMLVRALPPQYSTFTVACEHCHNTVQQRLPVGQLLSGSKQNTGTRNGSQDGRFRSSFSVSGNQQQQVTPNSHSVPANLTMVPGLNNSTTLTNTANGEQYRILVPTSSPDSQSIPRMPPSYSSIFRAGCAVLISENTGETYIATKDECIRYE